MRYLLGPFREALAPPRTPSVVAPATCRTLEDLAIMNDRNKTRRRFRFNSKMKYAGKDRKNRVTIGGQWSHGGLYYSDRYRDARSSLRLDRISNGWFRGRIIGGRLSGIG